MRLLFITVCALAFFFNSVVSATSLNDFVDRKKLDDTLKQSLGLPAENKNDNKSDNTPASIPLTGKLSDADEQALGREISGRLLSAYPLVKNDALQHYVNKVGRLVANRSSRPKLNWTFGVIESKDINAFSAPGGYVFITAGLYQLIENEAELAGVLGHEIAHVTQRHHVKLLQKSRGIELGRDVLLGNVQNDSVKTLAGNGAQIYARALDKNAEYECDRLGLQLAANAGYDPFAFVALLDRMGSVTDNADRLALLYKTHPHPADRLMALSAAIGSRWDQLVSVTTPPRMPH